MSIIQLAKRLVLESAVLILSFCLWWCVGSNHQTTRLDLFQPGSAASAGPILRHDMIRKRAPKSRDILGCFIGNTAFVTRMPYVAMHGAREISGTRGPQIWATERRSWFCHVDR